MTTVLEVVTPERYASGYTWEGYLEVIKANQERFQSNYQKLELRQQDVEFFRGAEAKLGTTIRVLAIGEDWCPDVYANLPIMARIAAAAGWQMRIFPRDQNQDIMNFYLRNGNMSIPVFVLFDAHWNELGRWIERSQAARDFLKQMQEEFANTTLSAEEARGERGRRLAQAYKERLNQETVREIRALLEK